jgi:hypothetical protein
MTESSRVYVVQELQHDYSKAEQFGELIFLSSREITPTAMGVSPANRAIIDDIKRNLHDYMPGKDYLLLAGSPIAIAWTIYLAFQRGKQHLALKWDNQGREYVRYHIDPSQVWEG